MLILFLAAQVVAGVLLAFSLRRAVLLVGASLPNGTFRTDRFSAAPENTSPGRTPFVLVLVPCRNEAASLPGLWPVLDRLDYPRDRLRLTLVDDCSTDQTVELAQAWTLSRPWARLLSLPANVGKAQALNSALAAELHPGFTPDLVVVYDADHRPAPQALRTLLPPLAQADTAAVCGQMRVANGFASPAAAYAMIESLVNQFVTMRAKDRLHLAPALLGSNCAYRLTALRAAGGFRGGALLEDSDLTLALALAGWRTRFTPASISEHQAPLTVRGYVRQHLRWNRGFHQVTAGRLGALWRSPRLSLPLKIELTFFAFGYADRLALLAALVFTIADLARPSTFRFPVAVWGIYLGLPALETLAALLLARERTSAFLRLVYVPFFFVLDVAVAAWSSAQSLLRRPVRWNATERADVGGSPRGPEVMPEVEGARCARRRTADPHCGADNDP
jgi:cellulose synthase/poly-beta-1,6-N-acetylglucosamine synthase-like glycosyltransferase